MPASTDADLRRSLPALFFYLSNVHQASGGWVEGHYLAFSHLWSLAIEEHFYLLWPWIIALLPAARLPAFCLIAFSAVAVARAAFLGPFHGDPNVAYLLTPFRCDGLLLGGFLASAIFDAHPLDDFFDISTWLTAIVGSIILLAIYRVVVGDGHRRHGLTH